MLRLPPSSLICSPFTIIRSNLPFDSFVSVSSTENKNMDGDIQNLLYNTSYRGSTYSLLNAHLPDFCLVRNLFSVSSKFKQASVSLLVQRVRSLTLKASSPRADSGPSFNEKPTSSSSLLKLEPTLWRNDNIKQETYNYFQCFTVIVLRKRGCLYSLRL